MTILWLGSDLTGSVPSSFSGELVVTDFEASNGDLSLPLPTCVDCILSC